MTPSTPVGRAWGHFRVPGSRTYDFVVGVETRKTIYCK
jgi:hypothetical protein